MTLLDTPAAAKRLKITPADVRSLVHKGVLPHMRLSNRFRFTPEMIKDFQKANAGNGNRARRKA